MKLHSEKDNRLSMARLVLFTATSFIALEASPMSARAALEQTLGILNDAILPIKWLSNTAFALALIAFFWGITKYIYSAGDPSAKESGRRIMVGGIIALFVAASVWGIVYFIRTEIGIPNKPSIPLPSLNI